LKILMKPFFGAEQSMQQSEDIIRKLNSVNHPINPEYWNFHTLLDPIYIKTIGAPTGEKLLKQLAQLCQTSTPLDWVFQPIPTFTPAPHAAYQGLIDFMVTNRWCSDFLTLCDRLTPGIVSPYPMQVPELDLMWMVLSFIVVAIGLFTWWTSRTSKNDAVTKTEIPKPVASAT
jgi:hypothetical protein